MLSASELFATSIMRSIGLAWVEKHLGFAGLTLEELVDRWLLVTNALEEDAIKERIYEMVYPQDFKKGD